MKILIASEHAGYVLKEFLYHALREGGYDITDGGVYSNETSDYPIVAEKSCRLLVSGEYQYCILVCGTGIGMSIAANKVVGIRAALCTDLFSARMTREHNDANVLCLAAWKTADRYSLEITKTFLSTAFTGDRHIRRVNQISQIERRELGSKLE